MVSGSRAVTQNVRTMSVEYRPRFVCCRADREKGVRECTQRPHPRLSPCEASTPPAARGTAYNTPAGRPQHSEQQPPFFPGQTSRWRRRKFHRRKFRRKKFRHYKNSVPCRSPLFFEISANFSRMFLEVDAPSKRYLQVGCWPHTSFGRCTTVPVPFVSVIIKK